MCIYVCVLVCVYLTPYITDIELEFYVKLVK